MSNYVLAGFETLPNYFKVQNWLTAKDVNRFFLMTVHKFLRSFGQNYKGTTNHVKGEVKILKDSLSFGIYDNCRLEIDSGGYQVSVGLIPRDDIPAFRKLLYEVFLPENVNLYQRAFILDIPPGPNCKVFESFDDIYRMNLESYQMAANLPKEARDKMIYIHHFRTPTLQKIYTKILRDNGFFDLFQYHGTGGLVANMTSDVQIPVIMSMLPLVQLLNEAKKYKRTSLEFHVLGGSTMRDVLFYPIFQKHIKKVHGIDVNIEYDSSGLYKGVMMGRTIPILDGASVHKLDLRESKLDFRFLKNMSIRQQIANIMTEMCDDMDLPHPDKQILDAVYYDQKKVKKDGTVKITRTFEPSMRLYISLYYLYSYKKAEDRFAKLADMLYPIYESGDIGKFNRELEMVTRDVNFGKITRKQKAKTFSVSNTLDMLTALDEDYCNHLIQKHLAKDEFIGLDDSTKVMTV